MYSIHQYNVGDYSSYASRKKGKAIRAEAERNVFLSFSSETGYIESAYSQLQDKCRDGKIIGINGKHSTDLEFLSHTDHFRLTGLYIK